MEAACKRPSFGVSGTKKAEYCVHHAPQEMVNVNMEDSIRPCDRSDGVSMGDVLAHNTDKGFIVSNSPTSVKRKTNDSPVRGIDHLDSSKDSRKRTRKPDVAVGATMRFKRESTTASGALVPLDPSLKTEISISL